MTAPIVALAESVTTYLNTLAFTQTVTAVKRNRVRDDLSAVQDLELWVVPQRMESLVNTRITEELILSVNVVVVREAKTDTEIDTMLSFTNEISEALVHQDMLPFRYAGQTNDPIYSAEQVDSQGIFITALSVNYKVSRDQEATPKS